GGGDPVGPLVGVDPEVVHGTRDDLVLPTIQEEGLLADLKRAQFVLAFRCRFAGRAQLGVRERGRGLTGGEPPPLPRPGRTPGRAAPPVGPHPQPVVRTRTW